MGGFARANGEMLVGENDCVEGIRNVGFCSAPCSVRRVGCGDGVYTGCVGRWGVGGQRWSPSENVRGVLRGSAAGRHADGDTTWCVAVSSGGCSHDTKWV